MFHPANNNKKFNVILVLMALPIAVLLLAAITSRVQAKSSQDIQLSSSYSEYQQTDSELLYNLNLIYHCNNNAEQYWTVTNPNSFEMSFEWFLETDEFGTASIPANSSYTFQTENIDQSMTIRYSFPQKFACREEKCGESEIIKLTVSSSTCEINPEELVTSPQEVDPSGNTANTNQLSDFVQITSDKVTKQKYSSMSISKTVLHIFVSQKNLFHTELFTGMIQYTDHNNNKLISYSD